MSLLKVLSLPIATFLIGCVLAVTNKPQPADHYVAAFPEQLPGAYTGGFGEETCHSCHFDHPLNPDKGSLTVEGIPEQYQPGECYTATISVQRSDLGMAGFQISSRFANGKQAGTFNANSEQLSFTESEENIQYLQHSTKGTTIENADSTQWTFTWIAPEPASEKIIINIAANAGNGDASAFGDYIYVREFKVKGSNP